MLRRRTSIHECRHRAAGAPRWCKHLCRGDT
jgi:hypothetical protein